MSTIALHSPLNISETVIEIETWFQITTIGNSLRPTGIKCHMTDDVTWPLKVKLVTPIHSERNVSKTAGFRDSVTKDCQYEMAYVGLNGHVIDDVRWPGKIKLVTAIRLVCNIS